MTSCRTRGPALEPYFSARRVLRTRGRARRPAARGRPRTIRIRTARTPPVRKLDRATDNGRTTDEPNAHKKSQEPNSEEHSITQMRSNGATGCFSGILRRKSPEPSMAATVGQAAVFVDEEVRRASLSLQRPERLRSSTSPERGRRSEEYGGDLHLLSA
jgi:hypothetical protein